MTQVVHVLPDHSRQRQVWAGDTITQGFIASGGLFTVPGGGGLTLAAQACEAYVFDVQTDELLYCAQSAMPVGPLNQGNGTYWVIIHRDLYTALVGWARQTGTRYLWQPAADVPELPSGTELLVKVTVSGGNITAVKDYRTPASFARAGVVDVTDPLYGAVSSPGYTTSSLVAINAALARSNQIYLPEGVYWLGDMAPGDIAFDLSALGAGIHLQTQGVVQFVCNTTTTGIPFIFLLRNNPDFRCDPVSFLDTGFDNGVTWRGAVAFTVQNLAGADDWERLRFESITAENMVGALTLQQSAPYSTLNRIRGIHVGTMDLTNCYYGYTGQNEGDGLTIDLLTATQTRRVYFVYGCHGHQVHLVTRRNYTSDGNVTISRGIGGLDTTGITVDYTAYEDDPVFYAPVHVHVSHIDLLGGTISGLDLNVNVKAPNGIAFQSVRFSNYTGSGGSETDAASLNYVADVRLRGSCDGNAEPVTTLASYLNKRQMTFEGGLNFLPNQSTLDAFQLTQQGRLVTSCEWGATGDAPVLGDGTLTYGIDAHNGMVTLSVHMVMGASTTFGTGGWYFWHFLLLGEYMNVKVPAVGSWVALDTGTAFFTGACKCNTGNLVISLFTNNSGSNVKSDNPFTWAVGDTLDFSITFAVSGD